MNNPRTARLLKITDAAPLSFRLTQADRQFLRDLARVQIISKDLATKHHYAHLKSGADRPLSRLTEAGILKEKVLHAAGAKPTRTFEFATDAVAKAWGGSRPVTGAKRTDLHELITSRLYFALGRPPDFRLARHFTTHDNAIVSSHKPDAMYTDTTTGELVVVEANAGHYTRSQVIDKVARWHSLGISKQVWGQPLHSSVNVPHINGVRLFQF